MSKTNSSNIISVIIVLILIGVVYLLVKRNDKKAEGTFEFSLEQPYKGVVESKKKIRGQISVAQKVNIKPQISGVVDQLFVKMGDDVQKDQPIAKIKVIPSPDELKEAQKNLETAEISFLLDKKTYEKNLILYSTGGVSQSKIDEVKANMDISELTYNAAITKLDLLLKSIMKGTENRDYTIVRSTSAGMVLDVPILVGASVAQQNSTRDGTTIVTIADLDSLVFESKINESFINKVYVGMPISLIISSMGKLKLSASIIEISPQSKNESGINKFEFVAKVVQNKNKLSYSGLTADANILFDKTDSVLCINEKYLQFDENEPFVEIWVNGESKVQNVTLGLSDGINVEVKSGLKKHHRLLLPSWRDE